MPMEVWIGHSRVDQFLYDWQTLIAGVLAVLAALGTIGVTIRSADREIEAAQKSERKADEQRERDRANRAEVVALRLSGWLAEVKARVQATSELFDHLRKHNQPTMPPPNRDLTEQLKLYVVADIKSVLSDLHYLYAGSGDVAQLDFHTRYFDAFLDQKAVQYARKEFRKGEMAIFYDNIEGQLRLMRELAENALRHLNPIIDAAIKLER